ncbi:unnamed protein product [Brachionus calyciflorus]|uniref:CUB domain-containing protein n=1 Tax=Brachionus calyciflorus TaxID=104777 RepID=A0A813TM44_9BILA|nr:unnamed protein product [Brachionus calyciflorus]
MLSSMLSLYLAYFLIILCAKSAFSVKFSTEPLCLNENSQSDIKKIICEDPTKSLFISLVEYTNDYMDLCSSEIRLNSTKPVRFNKNLTNLNMCSAYPTQELANVCNGKKECLINLVQPNFQYGLMGSNCEFKAKILSVSYECIPNSFDQSNIPKFNICPGGIVDHPLLGFIHTPNYPRSYDSSQFCQLTLKMNDKLKRIEIFLLDLETEGLSKRHFSPTDYLQINNKEIHYGKKSFILVYNDTQDATIVFRSDLFFNQKGFVLYFEAIQKPDPLIQLIEESDSFESETTILIPFFNLTSPQMNILNTSEINLNETLNFTSILNDTNSTLIENITQIDLYKSEKQILLEDAPKINKISSYFNEITLKTITSLIILIIILIAVIGFLIVHNRKKLFGVSLKYVDPALIGNNSQFYDASLINGYLESNNLSAINGSFIFAPSNSNLGIHLNQSGKNRLSDDSLKILLINKSINNTIEPVVLATKSTSSTETYDEIPSGKEWKKEEVKIDTHLAKVNEYCYIQANGLVSGGPETNEKLECSVDILDSKTTPPNSSFHSPNSESMITSTPSVPKTLPPSKDLSKTDLKENECDYQPLNKAHVKSVYRSCFDETNEDFSVNNETTLTMVKTTIEVEHTLVNEPNDVNNSLCAENENDYNIDYQIPTNILISN